MENPNDVRTHKLEPKKLTVHVELELVFEGEQPAFLSQLSDELADLLTKRIERTQGVTHLATPEWDISMP